MNAYLVLDLAVHDFEKFQDYINKIPAVIEKHAGRYIVQGEEPEVIEGDWNPERIVIIEFPSRAKAKKFYRIRKHKHFFNYGIKRQQVS